MVSRSRSAYLADILPADIWPNTSTFGAGTNVPMLCAGTIVLVLFSASAAHAQCTSVGLTTPPPPVTQATVAAVAGVSAYVGGLVSSIHSANTAFLSQSSAFIGSPANPRPDQPGGGAWARGVGGHLTFGTTATAGNINFGGPVAGSVTCNTRTVGDFAGVQVGADIARLNVNGWNLHAGSTIGYLGSKTRDATPSGLNPPASFRDSLQIPFAGVYVAASNGGFLVDLQLRGNFYQNEVSDNNHGLSGQRFDARGVSLTGNVGYNYSLGNNWFIEPSAGFVWSRTQVDPMNVPGTIVVSQGGIPPWTLMINDIDSTLGRLSVRVGTSVAYGGLVLQPFASASLLHEFQDGVTSSLLSNFGAIGAALPPLSSTVSISSPRSYGQFGLGVATQALHTGWLSFLRADYRTGDNIEGWSLNGGLRYQFVPNATATGREPMIVKAPVNKANAPPVYDWSGVYISGHLGATWGSTSWTFDGGGTTDPRFAGFLGGGGIGFDYQVSKWVFGIAGDAAWTNALGARPCPNGFFFNCEIDVRWLSTATVRVGYAPWDRLLVYAKGGAAIARDRARRVCNTNSQPTTVDLLGCPSQSDAKTNVGWTAGWGSEFGLTQNVSVSGEIMYFNLGRDRHNLGGMVADIQRDGVNSTVALRYRFGR
jgi:outer membrane autotransporter protein